MLAPLFRLKAEATRAASADLKGGRYSRRLSKALR